MITGTQIAYIPLHANGDIDHPDVEFGFVTSSGVTGVFCRFWRKGELGELRTVANSESCKPEDLIEHTSVAQWIVDQKLVELGYELI